jgi:hypothetical protein
LEEVLVGEGVLDLDWIRRSFILLQYVAYSCFNDITRLQTTTESTKAFQFSQQML